MVPDGRSPKGDEVKGQGAKMHLTRVLNVIWKSKKRIPGRLHSGYTIYVTILLFALISPNYLTMSLVFVIQ